MKSMVGVCMTVALAMAVSACTFKATTKEITDTTSNITGTTSGKSWFEGGLVKKGEEVNAFADLNFENLKQDLAAGRGEYLASLGTLLGIAPAHQADFFALAQAHYTTLLPSPEATPADLVAALNRLLAPYALN